MKRGNMTAQELLIERGGEGEGARGKESEWETEHETDRKLMSSAPV